MADFDRAIALDQKYAWAIARRGETYRLLGSTSRRWPTSTAPSPSIRRYLGHLPPRRDLPADGQYEQAPADFDQAIALDSSDWYLYGRALTYRILGQEAAATLI